MVYFLNRLLFIIASRPNKRQLIVFALVTMIYTPCISTIFVFISEFGWKKAAAVAASETALAIILGAVAYRLLSLFL